MPSNQPVPPYCRPLAALLNLKDHGWAANGDRDRWASKRGMFWKMKDNIPLAVAYYTNGINFRLSAERLREGLELDDAGRSKKLTAIPLYFLASHAAELFLKAALLKRGFPKTDLKKYDYRHNLETLLQELQKKGVPVSSDTTAVIHGLSEQHKTHQLRYTLSG